MGSAPPDTGSRLLRIGAAPLRRAFVGPVARLGVGLVAQRTTAFGQLLGLSARQRSMIDPSLGEHMQSVRMPEGVWPMDHTVDAFEQHPAFRDPGMAAIAKLYARRAAPRRRAAVHGLPRASRRAGVTANGTMTGPSSVARRMMPAETRVQRNESHGAAIAGATPSPAQPVARRQTSHRTSDATVDTDVVRAVAAYSQADSAEARAAAFAAAMGTVTAASAPPPMFVPPGERGTAPAPRSALWAAAAGTSAGFGSADTPDTGQLPDVLGSDDDDPEWPPRQGPKGQRRATPRGTTSEQGRARTPSSTESTTARSGRGDSHPPPVAPTHRGGLPVLRSVARVAAQLSDAPRPEDRIGRVGGVARIGRAGRSVDTLRRPSARSLAPTPSPRPQQVSIRREAAARFASMLRRDVAVTARGESARHSPMTPGPESAPARQPVSGPASVVRLPRRSAEVGVASHAVPSPVSSPAAGPLPTSGTGVVAPQLQSGRQVATTNPAATVSLPPAERLAALRAVSASRLLQARSRPASVGSASTPPVTALGTPMPRSLDPAAAAPSTAAHVGGAPEAVRPARTTTDDRVSHTPGRDVADTARSIESPAPVTQPSTRAHRRHTGLTVRRRRGLPAATGTPTLITPVHTQTVTPPDVAVSRSAMTRGDAVVRRSGPVADIPAASPGTHPAAVAMQERFLGVLEQAGAPRATPLPQRLLPLARSLSSRPILVTHDAPARAALRAVDRPAATLGNVIHLQRAPDSSPATMELLSHEMVHAAAAPARPRFFAEPGHDHEEHVARRVGRLARRSVAQGIDPATLPLAGGPVMAPRVVQRTPAAESLTPSVGQPVAGPAGAQVPPSPPNAATAHNVVRRTTRGGGARRPVDGGAGSSGGGEPRPGGSTGGITSTQRLNELEELIELIERRVIAALERRGGTVRRQW